MFSSVREKVARRARIWRGWSRALGPLTIVAVCGLAVFGASRLPRLLSKMEVFSARDFAMKDARFVQVEEALRWARIPDGASVWDDPSAWEERLRRHPLVEDVEIGRDLPGGLVFRVREVTPVALVPRPTLEPVDARGRVLPLDPSMHRLDLPVIRPRVEGVARELDSGDLAAATREMGRLRALDPRLVSRISTLTVGARDDLIASLSEPRVDLRFRPPLTALRLQEGMQALRHASDRMGPSSVRAVDLRYEDQVVVRLAGSVARRAD